MKTWFIPELVTKEKLYCLHGSTYDAHGQVSQKRTSKKNWNGYTTEHDGGAVENSTIKEMLVISEQA